MDPRVPMFLDARARARAAGDRGIEQAMTADLQRIGYVDPPERVTTPAGMETTAVRAPERAVPAVKPHPQRKGGRPPLPRCQHDRIVGRCNQCKSAA